MEKNNGVLFLATLRIDSILDDSCNYCRDYPFWLALGVFSFQLLIEMGYRSVHVRNQP